MIINRVWEMPNLRTFSIRAIAQLIELRFPSGNTVDPFANRCRIAAHTNDLDPEMECDATMDAYDYLQTFDTGSVDGVLFDPPYTPRQVSESYRRLGHTVNMETTQSSYWMRLRDEIARITKRGAVVITAGYNSVGIGTMRGFEINEILLVCHGGQHNDTIVVCETKTGLF